MFGSGIRYKTHLFITICIMCMLTGGNQIKVSDDFDNENEQPLAASGHLYDVFRKRLERMSKGLTNRPNNDILKHALVNNVKESYKQEDMLENENLEETVQHNNDERLENENLEETVQQNNDEGHANENLEDTVQQNNDEGLESENFDNSKINYNNYNEDETIYETPDESSQDNDITHQVPNAYVGCLPQYDNKEQDKLLKRSFKIRNSLQKDQFSLYDSKYKLKPSLKSDASYSKDFANLYSNNFSNTFPSRSTAPKITNYEIAPKYAGKVHVNTGAFNNEPKFKKYFPDLDSKDLKAINHDKIGVSIDDNPNSGMPARKVKGVSAPLYSTDFDCNGEPKGPDLPPNIMAILDRVLYHLQRIEQQDDDDGECPADGTPCDLCGLWNSRALGLALDISTEDTKQKDTRKPACTPKNVLLNIEVEDCTPPKRHYIMDCDWSFIGSAVKSLGGPFYMYAQPSRGKTIATFVGYCRVCGGTDTIFGSWSFALPSTDCQNIATSFEHIPDIMRRNDMEQKREDRYKEMLYKQKFGKKV